MKELNSANAQLAALVASVPGVTVVDESERGTPDTMDGLAEIDKCFRAIIEPKFADLPVLAPLPWPKEKPTRSGNNRANNRANNCDQRRARNKAARKSRMKQRLKAKKG